MYTYKIVEKSDGFMFLIYRGKKKIVKKSDYFLSYNNCLIGVKAEMRNWSK